MTGEPAGWYRDPSGRDGLFRWWTGRGWTNWMSDDDDAPPPTGEIAAVVEPAPRRRQWVTSRKLWWPVAAVVTVVVIATIIGMVVNARRSDSAATMPTAWATISQSQYQPTFDAETRQGSLGPVRLTVGKPWQVTWVERAGSSHYRAQLSPDPTKTANLEFGQPRLPTRSTTARVAMAKLLTDEVEDHGVVKVTASTWIECDGVAISRCYKWSGTIQRTKEASSADHLQMMVYQLDNDSWFYLRTSIPQAAATAAAAPVAQVWESVRLP